MAAMLTFHPRRALLEATTTKQAFHLPIYQDRAKMAAWEKQFEFRPGKYALWDHTFELPGRETASNAAMISRIAPSPAAMEIYDYPGAYAQRFDGVDKGERDAPHSHPGKALYVGTRSSGIYIHGWPPCNLRTCIIVLHHWDEFRRAVAGERRLSFSISV